MSLNRFMGQSTLKNFEDFLHSLDEDEEERYFNTIRIIGNDYTYGWSDMELRGGIPICKYCGWELGNKHGDNFQMLRSKKEFLEREPRTTNYLFHLTNNIDRNRTICQNLEKIVEDFELEYNCLDCILEHYDIPKSNLIKIPEYDR